MDEHEIDDITGGNESSYFIPREEPSQVIGRKHEKANTLESLKILQQVSDQLKDDIAFYGSVDSIPPEVKTDPKQFLIVHNANELVRNSLLKKKEYIDGLLTDHAPNR